MSSHAYRTHALISSGLAAGWLALTVCATAAQPPAAGLAEQVATLAASVAALKLENQDLQARVMTLENLLRHFSVDNDDIYITGANLNIQDGSGHSWGAGSEYEPAPNGKGNLVIGYNEETVPRKPRTGSHNLVLGPYHSYSSVGGLVAGRENTISGPYSSVSGGDQNVASGIGSSVSGGKLNTAGANFSSVSGGAANTASLFYSSVSGGAHNTASGMYSSVSGGDSNTASGWNSSIGGGDFNTASGAGSSVSGGSYVQILDPDPTIGTSYWAAGDYVYPRPPQP